MVFLNKMFVLFVNCQIALNVLSTVKNGLNMIKLVTLWLMNNALLAQIQTA